MALTQLLQGLIHGTYTIELLQGLIHGTCTIVTRFDTWYLHNCYRVQTWQCLQDLTYVIIPTRFDTCH